MGSSSALKTGSFSLGRNTRTKRGTPVIQESKTRRETPRRTVPLPPSPPPLLSLPPPPPSAPLHRNQLPMSPSSDPAQPPNLLPPTVAVSRYLSPLRLRSLTFSSRGHCSARRDIEEGEAAGAGGSRACGRRRRGRREGGRNNIRRRQ